MSQHYLPPNQLETRGNVEIIANSMGSGDWVQIKIDGVLFEEGHSISRYMVVQLLERLGHRVTELNVKDDFFP